MPGTAHYVLEKALATVLGLFVLVALFRGGNLDVVIAAALYVAAIAIVLAVAGRWVALDVTAVSTAALTLWAAIAVLCLLTLLGLTPTPIPTWLALPGRHYYAPVVALLPGSSTTGAEVTTLAFSLDPHATRRALVLATTCLAVAVAVQFLTRRSALQLLGAVALFVTFEALIGLLQLGFAGALTFGYAGHNRATGTFVNKNHFATMLAMGLPLLLMRATGQFTFFVPHAESGPMGRAWWGVAAAIVAVALIASASRAGILAAAVSSGVCAYLIWRRKRHLSRTALILGGVMLAGAAGLAWITGARRLLSTLSGNGLSDGFGTRALMNVHTWEGIGTFFPVGSGIGSYSVVFPRFQTTALAGFVEYAHNDYLQLLFEAGLAGALVILLLAGSAALTVQLARRLGDPAARLGPGVACMLGALAFAIHAWFDFPAHIPAIAIMATMLFGLATNPAVLASGQRRKPPVGTFLSADETNGVAPLATSWHQDVRPDPHPGA